MAMSPRDPAMAKQLGWLSLTPNEFNAPGQWRSASGENAYGNTHAWYNSADYDLAPDEALVIEATPPKCHYWNFQLGNIWAESLDYTFRQVHINNGSAKMREDGSFRLVVAHEDPGTDNWMDTAGHDHGTMCVRWVRADSHPEPMCRVVKLSDL